jgi:acetylornithine deacetylase/succinyl-diaminopimelate desuccinylase-like protein
VLLYGHGDTVRGLDDQWRAGLKPWELYEEDGRWYGRGSADNKGQHALNIAALEAVLAERGGKLGFNVKIILEMAEERGSRGLREFVAAHRDMLAADVLIASDGPRVEPEVPTIATGTRGIFQFDLVLKLRAGGVHSGHWGGLTTDPAIRMSHAIGAIIDPRGKILVRDWLPQNGVPAEVRGVLDGCPVGGGEGAATIDADWGEPGLTPAEKIYGWNSFIVLAMLSGKPDAPVNAVAPDARATCHIRYTVDTDPNTFEASLRRHLNEQGFGDIVIENAGVRMAASRTPPNHPWVRWAQESMQKTLGKRVQIIPNSSGGLPGDVFVDHLGVPLVWVPHSYNGCKQHGPDEHFLIAPAREGILAFTGMWWDLGQGGTP